MNFNEYQELAAKTASKIDSMDWTTYAVMGLIGEAGEVANKWKKVFRDHAGVASNSDKLEMADELGDVLWYVSEVARRLGFDLNDIAARNIQKLSSRAERQVIQGSGDNR